MNIIELYNFVAIVDLYYLTGNLFVSEKVQLSDEVIAPCHPWHRDSMRRSSSTGSRKRKSSSLGPVCNGGGDMASLTTNNNNDKVGENYTGSVCPEYHIMKNLTLAC